MNKFIVSDIDIPFWSLLNLMFKIVIAWIVVSVVVSAIAAILFAIGLFILAVIGAGAA